MVTAGGAAALSWEILWQIHAALSLGVSALGTAVTLATLMGGMALGAAAMGGWLQRRPSKQPIRTYGCLELLIGLSGLLLAPAFSLLQRIDSQLYQVWPGGAPLWHLAGIAIILGPPTLAMGASLPVFGLLARRYQTSLSALYAWNTAGAAIGVLVAAFVLLPALGIIKGAIAIAAVNACIAVFAFLLPPADARYEADAPNAKPQGATLSFRLACLVVFVTGFVTFGLEVAWFRSLRAAFFSTTYTFAILLAAVLVPLALAARKAARLRELDWRLGTLLAGAGVAILLATPVIERFDFLRNYYAFSVVPSWFVQTLVVIGPAIFLLGIPLPWLLDEQPSASRWARLYAANTSGSILGSLVAAWGLLPALGFARTAWLLGLVVLAVAAALCPARLRWRVAAAGVCSLAVAIALESGIGRGRTLGPPKGYELIAFAESPDSTVSVIDVAGRRHLFIDGFSASDETGAANYMAWMGRLPMLLHENPADALVICFGTGQTAHALREEGPQRLDIVDLSHDVFNFADKFPTNHGVLADPRTSAIVMDGRAWLRRTNKQYDVITLEPMPPTFAGVNALYSREFYELASQRLRPAGIVAQWLPIHLVDRYQAASVAAAFHDVFPDSILWLDPASLTGILLGRKGAADRPLGSDWPGLSRNRPGRTMDPDAIRAASVLEARGLARFAAQGNIITDDNQLLSYSWSIDPVLEKFQQKAADNLAEIRRLAEQ
jgi:predicted membrane-bound spermidine synthase